MERRNLDFGIEMTEAQWRELEQTADTLGLDRGFDAAARAEAPFGAHPIQVFMNNARGPDAWRTLLTSPDEIYGVPRREVAEFHFNGGRPFASIEVPPELLEPPAVSAGQEAHLQRELESWLRNRWHELLGESGIHYERGHIPQSGSAEAEEYR